MPTSEGCWKSDGSYSYVKYPIVPDIIISWLMIAIVDVTIIINLMVKLEFWCYLLGHRAAL